MERMNDPLAALVSAYSTVFEELGAATTGRVRRGPEGTVLAISGAPVAPLNAVISPGLVPSSDEIASLAASESPWMLPWSIHVRGIPGPLVTEVAAGYGLTRFNSQALMVRRPEQGLPTEPAVDGLRVRAVSVDEFDLYARTVAEGFEAPHEVFQVFAEPSLEKIDGMTFHLAELEGVPVGTGMTAVSDGLTGIFNITTLPAYRRRGYGRVVTMQMVREGFAAGAATAYLCATKSGESVYASVGFRTEEYLTVITAP
ncbi:GNAT family N-acetyltransferase [Streptomyces mirabilis]|uniref:GNAT family N-acetyltransferase n=1 Tax=Streptomyces mirabilis TaxID=68239 RepID=A0ABU3V5N8_9ACTN|nr:GNAT family N-acetyltransferase [Streptomyces mirabilis]MCX5355853.1 GNAT family N-acetyltransferase [Streptomyces mirabilis]MDU9001494.1 GNAT family N-acetyltransferase [Streptomyces mirabilis]